MLFSSAQCAHKAGPSIHFEDFVYLLFVLLKFSVKILDNRTSIHEESSSDSGSDTLILSNLSNSLRILPKTQSQPTKTKYQIWKQIDSINLSANLKCPSLHANTIEDSRIESSRQMREVKHFDNSI